MLPTQRCRPPTQLLLLLPLMVLVLLLLLPPQLALGDPCMKWRHRLQPPLPQPPPLQRVRGAVGVIESSGGLREVVALLGNGTMISYSISIGGAVGPSVALQGLAAAPPVILGRARGEGTAQPRAIGAAACPAASSELVAVLVGGNVTVVNGGNMAKCWSTRVFPGKAAGAAQPFRAGLALVQRLGVLVAAVPAAAGGVLVVGLRMRDGLVLSQKTIPSPPAAVQGTLAPVVLVTGEQFAFVATPGPASVVTALALSNSSGHQPVAQWRWTAPRGSGVSAMLAVGPGKLVVALSSGGVVLLSFSSSSAGHAVIVWHEEVSSGGEAAALSLAPAGWSTSQRNGSVLLVSTREPATGGVAPSSAVQARGRVVALGTVDGGVLWTAAAPTSLFPLTAAGGCAPSEVSLYVAPPGPAPKSRPHSALLNDTVAVFGCPDSVHAVSNTGEIVWSLALPDGMDSVTIGQDGLIYGEQSTLSADI